MSEATLQNKEWTIWACPQPDCEEFDTQVWHNNRASISCAYANHPEAVRVEVVPASELEREQAEVERVRKHHEEDIAVAAKRIEQAEAKLAEVRVEVGKKAEGAFELYQKAVKAKDRDGQVVHGCFRDAFGEILAILITQQSSTTGNSGDLAQVFRELKEDDEAVGRIGRAINKATILEHPTDPRAHAAINAVFAYFVATGNSLSGEPGDRGQVEQGCGCNLGGRCELNHGKAQR